MERYKTTPAPLAATTVRSWKTRSRSANERCVGVPARPARAAFGEEESRDRAGWSGTKQPRPRWPPRQSGLGRTDHDPPMRGVWESRRDRRGLLSVRKSRATVPDGAVQNNPGPVGRHDSPVLEGQITIRQ